MATSYSVGAVSLTKGSAVVLGIGTLWQAALIAAGDIYVEAPGNVLPIKIVEAESRIVSELKWTGESGDYAYVIERKRADAISLDITNRSLAEMMVELRAGTIYKFEAAGTLAGRSMYDGRPAKFGYLVMIGVDEPLLYVKASDASGDWAGPFSYGTGPIGPPPSLAAGPVNTLEAGMPATSTITGGGGVYSLLLGIPRGSQGYRGWTTELEAVADGPRQVLRVAGFIGGEGVPPDGAGLYIGNGGFVADIADAVSFRGNTGAQGPRGVVWRGHWTIADAYSTGDLVVDEDAEGDPATFIALAENAGRKPINSPDVWGYFPASVPQTINDGLWGDAITETSNDGIWGA